MGSVRDSYIDSAPRNLKLVAKAASSKYSVVCPPDISFSILYMTDFSNLKFMNLRNENGCQFINHCPQHPLKQ